MRTTTIIPLFSAVLLCAASACDPKAGIGDSGDASAGEEGGEAESESDSDSKGSSGSTSGGSSSGSESGLMLDVGGGATSGDVLDVGGGGPVCDPLLQDCADGDGCYPEGAEGFACAGHVDDPGAEGAACDVHTECAPGLSCASADDVDSCDDGSCCTPFCDLAAPACGESTCVAWSDDPGPGLESVGYCGNGDGGGSGDTCDPLLQDCVAAEGCYDDGAGGFACDSEGAAAIGQACDAGSDCRAGGACRDADELVGCGDERCCAAFCDQTEGDPCGAGETCVDWGAAVPGLESVGFCGA